MSLNIFNLSRPAYTLPSQLSDAIELFLKTENVTSQYLAECILRMSDFYIDQPLAPTPWHERWCQLAQLAYFLPLNFLRAQAVWDECQKQIDKKNFEISNKGLVDFGSGLGAACLPLILENLTDSKNNSDLTTDQKNNIMLSQLSLNFSDLFFVERSAIANQLFLKILQSQPNKQHFTIDKNFYTPDKIQKLSPDKSILCSYSLTEHEQLPNWLLQAHSVIIIEPATRDDGRKLLKTREQLISNGFYIAAPCTHQKNCPLLHKSEHDWCHDRIQIQMPDWFKQIEKNLPIKNENLTFSYLLAQKNKPANIDTSQNWRMTGDTLIEKGKSRQMICRGSEREFLSWMHRKFPKDALIPRGLEIDGQQIESLHLEDKGQELRLT